MALSLTRIISTERRISIFQRKVFIIRNHPDRFLQQTHDESPLNREFKLALERRSPFNLVFHSTYKFAANSSADENRFGFGPESIALPFAMATSVSALGISILIEKGNSIFIGALVENILNAIERVNLSSEHSARALVLHQRQWKALLEPFHA